MNVVSKGVTTPQAAGNGGPVRVMITDDSAVIRGLIARALEQDAEIEVVSSVADGQMAVNALGRHDVDVIVLDIEMPVMDGLTALPKLLALKPHVKVIIASTLSQRGADVSLKAMRAGAADYIPKPSSSRELGGSDDFKRELIGKVKALGHAARRETGGGPIRAKESAAPAAGQPLAAAPPRPAAIPRAPGPVKTTGLSEIQRVDVIAIGSSTGGPQALFEVVSHLKGLRQPVLITQHMPPTFTAILADHLCRNCGVEASEAKDGEPLLAGHVYVAPGNFHMTVQRRGGTPVIVLNQDPPENFCRPAVDVMLRSLAQLYNRNLLIAILTGMGSDGTRGCAEAVQAGGQVIAQDEPTSVVWGMPGSVAHAGLANAILPINQIGQQLRRLASRYG